MHRVPGTMPDRPELEEKNVIGRCALWIATACAMLPFAIGPAHSQDKPLRKINYAISSAVSVGHSHLTSIPRAMGYFKEEGLDVNILSFPGAEVLNHLVAGEILAADGGTPAAFAANAAGRRLITIFASVTGNPYYVSVPEGSSIKSLSDFTGKNIGVYNLAAAGLSLLRGQMLVEGVDPAKVNFIVVPSPAEAVDAIKRNRIVAYHGFDIFYEQMAALGVPQRRLTTATEDLGGLVGLSVTPETLKKERETLIKMARAFVKGIVFAKENPEAAVRLTWQEYPATRPIGMSEADALAAGLRILVARHKSIDKVDGFYGNATEKQISTVLDVMRRSGMMQKAMKAEEVWSDTIIREANNIDVDSVREQARRWKK